MNLKISTSITNVAVSMALACTGVPAVALAQEGVPSALEASVMGAENQASDFTFADGAITAYTGTSTEVVVPASINGQAVKSIGTGAFKDKGLTKLTLNKGLESIGESAFENNALKSVEIPDTVTSIGANAFRLAGSADSKAGTGLKVSGMKGVTELSDGSFSGMYDLSLDIPSLEKVNEKAFEPAWKGEYSYERARYARLFTGNDNAHKLDNLKGVYLVDPVTLTTVSKDADTGAVLKTETIPGEFATDYSNYRDLDSFFKKGEMLSDRKAGETISGYARPVAAQTVKLDKLDTRVEFAYKAFAVHAPAGVEKTAEKIDGKTLSGATVELYAKVKEPGSYWAEDVKLATATASEKDGSFSFSLKGLPNFDLANYKDKLVIKASTAKDSEFTGTAPDFNVSVGTASSGIERADQIELKAKQGDPVSLPISTLVHFTDGTSKEMPVSWTNSRPSTDVAGDFWIRGSVYDESNNATNVFAKVTVEADDKVEAANTDALMKALEQGRSVLKTALSSSTDGADVDAESYWVPASVYQKLSDAIANGDKVAKDKYATQSAVNEAADAVSAAADEFATARKAGVKPGTEITTGSVQYQVFVETMTDGVDNPGIKLKNSATGDVVEPSVSKDDDHFTLSFDKLPFGTWQVIAPDSLVPTVHDYATRLKLAHSVTLSKDHRDFVDHLYYKKGIRVFFDMDGKGRTDGKTEVYYLPGEPVGSLDFPFVETDDSLVFDGFSKDKVNLIDPSLVVTGDMTLTALYHAPKGDTVNENTDIDGYWKIGDFTYAQDTKSDTETRGKWMITGLSNRGKEKLKRNSEITLPTATYLKGENIDTNEVTYVGWKATEDDSADGAFESSGITAVNIPEGIVGIYPYSFLDNNISSVSFPSSLEWLGIGSFMKSNVREVRFNDGIKNIREGAFADNALTHVEIPDSIKLIEPFAFSGNKISKVKLPAQLEKIQKRAFYSNALVELEIPTTVNFIEDEAFGENSGIVTLWTTDRTNPNHLSDGSTFRINPGIPDIGQEVDKTALKALAGEAEALRTKTVVADDDSKIEVGTFWVTKEADAALSNALIEANYQLESGAATKESVESARLALDKAFKAYKQARKQKESAQGDQPGKTDDIASSADKDALRKLVSEAGDLRRDVQVAKDGSHVAVNKSWVTKEADDALVMAVGAAQARIDDEKASKDSVEAARAALGKAIEAFREAVKPGAKPHASWKRIYGEAALDTMAEISREGWGNGSVETVVLATSSGYWDALSASALAGAYGSPILLTDRDELSSQARDEIKRLGAKNAIIIGGSAAVSEAIESDLSGRMGLSVERIGGQDASETAAMVSSRSHGVKASDTCIVATVHGFYDSLSIAPAAYAKGMPVFLADSDNILTTDALDRIKQAGFSNVVIVGGSAAVSATVEKQLEGIGLTGSSVKRVFGQDAWETSAAIAEYAVSRGLSFDRMGVADGCGYWDALAGAALCGKNGSVMVLVPHGDGSMSYNPYCIDMVVKPHGSDIAEGYVFGGEFAVAESTMDALVAATKVNR
ncbi:leucine-rich repeat protein [Gordonibacter sp. Marseille-P4307]|uniref:leucine-rich repeat protein n=1 Tax=Gordonibacter sp. Marseille-P4307 TaxID=2161815 RepID=UPI000F5495F3|nr:leucine-rich repeat protein [Gordonibacter sp. Marseille-P4307]